MDGDFFFGTSTLDTHFNEAFVLKSKDDIANNFKLYMDEHKENPPLLSDLFLKTKQQEVFTPLQQKQDDETFGRSDESNEMDQFLLKFNHDENWMNEKKLKKEKEQKIYNVGEIITLKRGRKFLNEEEKNYSKNDFIKYYQNIWRLLFRKNSTKPLSNYGKACCSYYANKTFTQCPSGKSPIHDLFRTFEHIWNVIEIGKGLNIAYGLTHFFFMKALIPWKKQTRFSICPTKPDIEPLENDRVFQNGKYRTYLQQEEPLEFVGNRLKNKKELETLKEQISSLWTLINSVSGYEIPIEQCIPSMDLMMNVLQNLILAEECYEDKSFSWPINPLELNFEQDLLTKNIYLMAKLLSLYGSLIRKSKHFQISKGEIAAMPNIIFRKEDFFIVQQPKLGMDFMQELVLQENFIF